MLSKATDAAVLMFFSMLFDVTVLLLRRRRA
jgi:hypothetical protein